MSTRKFTGFKDWAMTQYTLTMQTIVALTQMVQSVCLTPEGLIVNTNALIARNLRQWLADDERPMGGIPLDEDDRPAIEELAMYYDKLAAEWTDPRE